MNIYKTKSDLQNHIERLKDEGKAIGFVPTMGALHDGHLSLVNHAIEQCDAVIISIFVNPTQFAEGEDFDTYPRQEDVDIEKLSLLNGDIIVYCPNPDEIYNNAHATPEISLGNAAQGLESVFRPHFFKGVADVVYRFFDHVNAHSAFFGEKDFQQLMVIKEMVATMDLPIEIIGCPTIRDSHGLALSSRNAYLTPDEIEIARKLNEILNDHNLDIDRKTIALKTIGFNKIDYLETRWNRILFAGYLGQTRLIDNVPATPLQS